MNAVYHRGYDVREPVEVRVLPDYLTITSQPGPDRSIPLADLKKKRFVSRRYRNRRIGEFLKELDLTEGRGTGIPKIMGAIRKNRSPEPKFETNRQRSFFTVAFPVHPKAQVTRASLDTHPKVGTKSALSRHQVVILSRCMSESTLVELMEIVSRSDRTKFRNQVIKPMIQDGIIEMTVPAKPNSRFQKYRLTTKGRAMIDENS